MKKKVISLILLLVGIAGANHAQSLWELIPLYPIPPVDIPGLMKGRMPTTTFGMGAVFEIVLLHYDLYSILSY